MFVRDLQQKSDAVIVSAEDAANILFAREHPQNSAVLASKQFRLADRVG